jgi:hypothetical protein
MGIVCDGIAVMRLVVKGMMIAVYRQTLAILVPNMRTRQRICQAKQSYPDRAAADVVAARHGYAVLPYRCDRCHAWHLTSRRKGRRIPKPAEPNTPQARLPNETPSGSAQIRLSDPQ